MVRWSSSALRWLAVLAGILLGSTAGLAQTAPVLSGRNTIQDVIIQGNVLVPAQRITSLIKTKPGANYQQETIDDDVRELVKSRLFRDVRVEVQTVTPGRVIVNFLCYEYPGTIQEIVYEGANHAKKDELNTITGLHKGSPMNPVMNKIACVSIVHYYNDKGRPFASCELKEGSKSTDTRVVFQITEGPEVKVRDIEFVGNTFVVGGVLETHITTSKAFLATFGGKFSPTIADMDVLKLQEYYRSFGFHDVKVSRELKWSADLQYVTLVFHIDEGTRYRVEGSQVVGATEQQKDKLNAVGALQPGFYEESKSKQGAQRIKDALGYEGINATVRENVIYDDKNPGLMTVNYQIIEQPPARVGQIQVIGNTVTRENVIRRQLLLYPGQILTYPDIRLSEDRLDRLGIFQKGENRPTIGILNEDNPDSPYKDLLVRVEEDRTGSLMFGIGVNSDSGLTGSIVLNEKNFDICRFPTSFDDFLSNRAFRGAGQEFRVEVMPGTQVQRYDVSWREPSLFDSPYYYKQDLYYYTRAYTEYHESRLGGRETGGRRLDENWSVYASVRTEDVGVHEVPFYAPFDFQKVVGDNFLAGLKGGLVFDTRDSVLRPTKGLQMDLSYEQVLGDFTFPKFTVDATQYFTVWQRNDGSGRHVLALRSLLAIEGSQAPVFERYYAGGFQSLRGFAFRGVGPAFNGFELGGDFMWLNSIEYQVPIKSNDHLYFVTFLDSGTVEPRYDIRNYRVSAGVGLRVVVPMLGQLPIALDLGFPIVKGPEDHEQNFSFWLGFFH
jgi:outer membrane protein assembly factor BamA